MTKKIYNFFHFFKVDYLKKAFLAGLKSTNPQIRQMFFEIFNINFNSSDLYDRLCFIVVTQNWEAFGSHYWIKQCIQMTLGSCANSNSTIQYSDISSQRFKLPSFLYASPSNKKSRQDSPQCEAQSSDKTSNNIMMNLETNLKNENILGISLDKPLVNIMDKKQSENESELSLEFANKKAMNILQSNSQL